MPSSLLTPPERRCSRRRFLQATALLAPAFFDGRPASADELLLRTGLGLITIRPLKHASVMFTLRDKYYYVDPAQLPIGVDYPRADAIFITHEHPDHCDPFMVQALRKPGCIVIGCQGAVTKLGFGEVMKNGDGRPVLDTTVDAVPAYNSKRKEFHPQGRDNGYVFTIENRRVYFAGDTEPTPEMKSLKNIDIAFLPISLPDTMSPKDAADAARAFHPRVLVPYHQGSSNPQDVADALKDTDIQVRVFKLP